MMCYTTTQRHNEHLQRATGAHRIAPHQPSFKMSTSLRALWFSSVISPIAPKVCKARSPKSPKSSVHRRWLIIFVTEP
jgi:hypothetical protein